MSDLQRFFSLLVPFLFFSGDLWAASSFLVFSKSSWCCNSWWHQKGLSLGPWQWGGSLGNPVSGNFVSYWFSFGKKKGGGIPVLFDLVKSTSLPPTFGQRLESARLYLLIHLNFYQAVECYFSRFASFSSPTRPLKSAAPFWAILWSLQILSCIVAHRWTSSSGRIWIG